LRRSGPLVSVAVLAGLVLAGSAANAAPRAQDPAAPPPGGGLPQGAETVQLDPDNFTADITNPYLPLAVGERWVSEEVDQEGNRERIELTVLDETYEVALGIETRVIQDTVTMDGEVVEDTRDWYAQDSDGNVWYFGEDTAKYESGKVSMDGSWEAGVDGAQPGIAMPAEPRRGLAYRLEYLAGQAEDRAVVLSADEMVELPLGSYDDVVLTRDTNGVEPDVSELKFFAPGIGQVLVLQTSGGSARVTLVETTRTGP
jgi:hypothetical protein